MTSIGRRGILLGIVLLVGARSASAAGDIDPSFDAPGTSVNGSAGDAALAVQADGKVVVVGATGPDLSSTTADWLVMRHLSTGGFDPDFGVGGKVVTDLGGSTKEQALAVLVEPGGSIVVAGDAGTGSGTLGALARYTATGTLDPSFGVGGVARLTTTPGVATSARAIIRQADGMVVVAGEAGGDLLLARFDGTGALDPTFGTAGFTITNAGGVDDVATALVLLSDGRLIVAGQGNGLPVLGRYSATGMLDSGFGSGGLVTLPVGGSGSFTALLQQPDGYFVAGAQTTMTGLVARFDSGGILDPGFGSAGVATVFSGPTSMDLTRQADGKLIAVGTTNVYDPRIGYYPISAAARLTANGSGDSTFHLATGSFASMYTGVVPYPGHRMMVTGARFGDMSSFETVLLRLFTHDSCGDGVVDPGENCDDGNVVDGDCCSATCTFEPAAAPCATDDVPCTLDRCDGAGTCTHVLTDGLPCDDGNLCTADDVCTNGGTACAGQLVYVALPCGSCDPATGAMTQTPRTDCISAGSRAASLSLDSAPPAPNGRVTWKWRGEGAANFGDPIGNAQSGHELCLFDESGPTPVIVFGLLALPDPLGACTHPPCWKQPAVARLTFREPSGGYFGAKQLMLRADVAGNLQLKAVGGGTTLATPASPLAMPLRAQLRARDGGCWEARFSAAGVHLNGNGKLRARSD